MAETESGKDLLSVLWAGADILRGKMDANEYKTYLLGLIFYKYFIKNFLIFFLCTFFFKKCIIKIKKRR